MKKNNKRKGFTIVELVIVIAVIAILAAVMIPTFSGMIEKANESANLQTARSAYSQYLANVDYAKGEVAGTVYVKVDEGVYYKVEEGEVDTNKVTTLPAGLKAIDTDGNVISVDAKVTVLTKTDENDTTLQNQSNVTVSTEGNVITITTSGTLTAYPSSAGKGEHEWVALVIDTNTEDITKVQFDGKYLTDADVAEANERDADEGCFILWVYEGGRPSFTLGASTYEIKWETTNS